MEVLVWLTTYTYQGTLQPGLRLRHAGIDDISPPPTSSNSLSTPHPPTHTPNPTFYGATVICSLAFPEIVAVYSSITTPTSYSAHSKLDLAML